MCAAKMILLPIFGVLFVQGLSNHTSLYPKEDKILSFVAMLLVSLLLFLLLFLVLLIYVANHIEPGTDEML